MPRFTHLHTHSEYSLLDGLARVPDLVQTAKDRGFEALALTDHGVMFGAVQFFQKSIEAGIKPLLGCEVYVAKRGRTDRDPAFDRKPYHLTILAENDVGYRNLMAMISVAQLEGFYYRPRVDRELLEKYSEGLVVMSGCAGSEVCVAVRDGRMNDARAAVDWFRQVFPGRYYIELMVHDIDFIPMLNKGLLELAAEFDLPTVATNDVHYCRETDVRAHEVLLCVQTGTTMNDPKRMRIGDTFYLRTEEEMRLLFAEMPGAVDRTAEIAERCNVTLKFNEYKLPKYDAPAGKTAGQYLLELCKVGLAERYPTITPEIQERLTYELGIIGQMGFDDYFLIVWDMCRFAADQGIWWNVRGSGAGSIVAYALRITCVDPIKHKLIFERFLNPSRVSMPDIDLDFPDDQRDLVIRYTFQKYGHDRVAQIITFGTMGARGAVRDAGRALDMELDAVDRVARLIPAVPGKACGIADTLRPENEGGEVNEFYTPDLVTLRDADPEVENLLDTARSLEGVARHASTHAAGVVISDRPLVDYVPLHRPTKGSGEEGEEQLAVTQFDMNDVDQLGLLKVDFLGLATLTVLRRCAELVERYHGKKYTLDTIPLDDKKTFELLSSGNTTGVFQVEGAGMRRMLREMQPKKFEHIVAAIALYRPGPMEYIPTYIKRMHGVEKVKYRHPRLEPILDETYGIIVYQEQIIQIARDLFGYDAGEADLIRKAVSKKIKEKLLQHRKQFALGASQNNIPAHVAEGVFDDIETFARYGFNKAHAADYAVIVCETAYLKAHYPVEYAAALLSVERDDTDKIALVAADCRRNGIVLLAPDINASELEFTIETLDAAESADESITHERGIRFGLGAIKNVGEGAVLALIQGRVEGGPFTDLDDLCLRVDLRSVGKRAIESLMKAGAFDSFGERAQLLSVVDRMVSASGTHHQAAAAGQMSLFGDMMPAAETAMLYPLPEAHGDLRAELSWEKELIGLYLSEHPLHRVAEHLAETVTVMASDVTPEIDGQPVTLAGMVTRIRRIVTKKGSAMAFARVEDLSGDVELTVFPRTFEETKDVWVEDSIVLVHGKAEVRGDRTQVIVNSVRTYDPQAAMEAAAAAKGRGSEAGDVAPARVTEVSAPTWPEPAAVGNVTAANVTAGNTTMGDVTESNVVGSIEPAEAPTPIVENETLPEPTAESPPDDGSQRDVESLSDAASETDAVPEIDAAREPADPPSQPADDSPGRAENDELEEPPDYATRPAADTTGQPPSDTPQPVPSTPPPNEARANGAEANGTSSEPSPSAPRDLSSEANAATPANGKEANGATPTSSASSRPEGVSYDLVVRLPAMAESSEGVELLGEVFNMLSAYEGVDRFVLLVPNGPEVVELEFPNSSTRYCVDLLRKLEAKVGAAGIKVTARQPAEPQRRQWPGMPEGQR